MGKPHIRLKAEAEQMRLGAVASHVAASQTSTDVMAWQPARKSADGDLLQELPAIVSRARDIDRNDGVARGGIQTIVDNVVGTGLRLSARPNYKMLGQSKEWAKEIGTEIEGYFHAWWHTTACHAGDSMTGDQISQQNFRAQLGNGEWVTLPMWIDRGDGYMTKLQTVESDRLSQPYGRPETARLRAGVEFDQYGAPIAYHIKRTHPGDQYYDGAFEEWERIPRRTEFGRLRVLHGFDCERSGQSRGKPLLTAVLPEFKQISRYKAAELMAAVNNAMVAMTIETPMDAEDIVELFKTDAQREYYLKARQDYAVGLKGGTMLPLFPGDKANSFLPARPNTAFANFVENMYRIIGVGLDLPYELLMKDFSKTNYSSARAAMLEAWRSFNRRRDTFGTQWLDPVYGLFLEELVNDGRIKLPDFYAKRAFYQRCRWIGPGRGWVDPVKEADASVIRLANNLSTLEQEAAEQGLDWEEVLEQRAIEMAEMKRLGLEPAKPEPRAPTPYQSDVDDQQPTKDKQAPAVPA